MLERDSSQLNTTSSQSQIRNAFDFSYPLSLPSQPPDVGNWFSSYEYESPDLSDPPNGFIDGHENNDSETQDQLQILSVRDSPQQEKDHQILVAEVKEIKCDVGDENNIGILFTDERELSLNRNQNVAIENNKKLEVQASSDGFISMKKREFSRMSTTVNCEANKSYKRLSKVELIRENDDDGFVAKKRSVLEDRTNVQGERGIQGKWKCPRKDKPHVEPPMKQLRLEQWVRRVS